VAKSMPLCDEAHFLFIDYHFVLLDHEYTTTYKNEPSVSYFLLNVFDYDVHYKIKACAIRRPCDQIMEGEMGRACSTRVRNEKCIQNFGRKT